MFVVSSMSLVLPLAVLSLRVDCTVLLHSVLLSVARRHSSLSAFISVLPVMLFNRIIFMSCRFLVPDKLPKYVFSMLRRQLLSISDWSFNYSDLPRCIFEVCS